MINDILARIEDTVLCVYKTGSAIFCDNCKDTDIIVITDGNKSRYRLNGFDGYDIWVKSKKAVEATMSAKRKDISFLYLLSLEKAKNNMLYGENPFPDFNLLDYKEEIVTILISQCKEKYCNGRYSNAVNKDACLKQSIWLLANYFALLNNSFDFTDEQTEILQKCHDNELPRSYLQKIYDDMKSFDFV